MRERVGSRRAVVLTFLGRPFVADSMDDYFHVICPYCGEELEIYIEPDVSGTFVQDCEVCCNPWRVSVRRAGRERDVDVARADGSE